MIETKRKVAFRYLECGTDGKQRPERREDGTVRAEAERTIGAYRGLKG